MRPNIVDIKLNILSKYILQLINSLFFVLLIESDDNESSNEAETKPSKITTVHKQLSKSERGTK